MDDGLREAQTAKYDTGPDEAHQAEVKIRTGPHHKGQRAAPIRTAKARDPHRSAQQRPEIRTKFLVSNLHPQSFV